MVKLGHEVTAFNRRGHHVARDEYDSSLLDEYKGVKIKTVPTINGKRARDIIGSTKKTYDN